MKSKICLTCGITFKSKYADQKFCSHKCYGISLRGKLSGRWLNQQPFKEKRTCPTCGEKFIVTGDIRNQIYCSRDCYHKSPKIRKIRSLCRRGENNTSKKEKIKLKISKSIKKYWQIHPNNYGMSGKHHTLKTIELLRNIPHPSGSEHHNWKGGITEEQQRARNSEKYEQWRTTVLKRDNYTCQNPECKSKNNLIAHHLLSFAKYPELRFDVDNGLTLCRTCHYKRHKRKTDIEITC